MPPVLLLATTFGSTLFSQSVIVGASIGVALKSAAVTTGLAALSLLTRSRPDARVSTREVRSSNAPARWILGKARVSGVLVFYSEKRLSGDKNEPRQVDIALVISEGACEGIEKVWVDGKVISFNSKTNVAGGKKLNISNNVWSDRLSIWEYFNADGTGGQSLQIASVGQDGVTRWTLDHKLKGVSWVHIQMTQNEYKEYEKDPNRRFYKGYPQIEFLIKGIKITWPGQTTPAWTDNAAALRYWYLIDRIGIDPKYIKTDMFSYSYAICNQQVSLNLPSSYSNYDGDDIKYSINGIITSNDDSSSILEEMDFCWQGSVVEADGYLYFRPGAERTTRFTITQDHILGVGAISSSPSIQDRINAISMSLDQSSYLDYKPQDLKILKDTQTITDRDQGNTLWSNLGSRRFVQNPISAGRLMNIAIKRARAIRSLIYTVSVGGNLEFLNLLPGDVLKLVDPYYGFDLKMDVVRVKVNDDWTVTVELLEHFDEVYDDVLHLPPLPDGSPRDVTTNDPRDPEYPDIPDFDIPDIG